MWLEWCYVTSVARSRKGWLVPGSLWQWDLPISGEMQSPPRGHLMQPCGDAHMERDQPIRIFFSEMWINSLELHSVAQGKSSSACRPRQHLAAATWKPPSQDHMMKQFSNRWYFPHQMRHNEHDLFEITKSGDDLFTTPWTAAHQAPLSVGFSRQGYWSRVPLPSPVTNNRLLKQTFYGYYNFWLMNNLKIFLNIHI